MTASTFPALVQRFFTEHLTSQMEASPNTVAAYRDTFRLLLRYCHDSVGLHPTRLRIEDIDATLIGNFLLHIETVRDNSARSRNAGLDRDSLVLPLCRL